MKTLRTPQELYDIMNARYRELTGFDAAEASDIGIRLRVLAQELHTLEAELKGAYSDAFPQTALASALELHAQARGLARRAARCAAGVLRFSRTAPGPQVTVPAGTLCMSRDGALRFETTQAGSLPEGALEAELPARALKAGASGNVARGTVSVLVSAVPGIGAVSNPAAFCGGEEAEGDESLRARLLEALSRPPDAANRAYYEAIAREEPGVLAVKLAPRARGGGTLDVVIACRSEGEAGELVPRLQERYDRDREIGTDLLVRRAPSLSVDAAAVIVAEEGCDPALVARECSAALEEYLNGLSIGQPLRVARLAGCLLRVDGVENFRLVEPAGDVIPQRDEIIRAGEVMVGRVATL